MKKVTLISLMISVIFTALGFAANLISYFTSQSLLFCFTSYGGEVTSYEGFGLRLTRYYPMSDGVTPVYVEPRLRFGPVSLILTLVAAFIVCFVIATIIHKVRAKKS